MFRQLSSSETLNTLKYVKSNFGVVLRKHEWLKLLTNKLTKVPITLRNQSTIILKEWIYQCECVFAQRLRRGQQMFCLYSRLWEEKALRNFIKEIQKRAASKGRSILLAAVGITYDWKNKTIPDAEIYEHQRDLDYIKLLKEKTICDIQKEQRNRSKNDCPCENRFRSCELKMYDTWTVFIEQDDLIVWRRWNDAGAYEYKVYGLYNDVTAEDFLAVQLDTLYRQSWDPSAVQLEVIESDETSNSDIIYWETQWPKFFANRDYVFNRRYLVDIEDKTMYLINRSTVHPAVDKVAGKFRIEDYKSVMVIKPLSDFREHGIEFSLTYFDNPGVNIPATVTTWVAMKAMPEFLTNLRHASKKYKNYCTGPGTKCYTNLLQTVKEVSNEYKDDEVVEEDEETVEDELITDDTTPDPQIIRFIRRSRPPSRDVQPPLPIETNSNSNSCENNEPSIPTHNNTSYWRYLQPAYYFS